MTGNVCVVVEGGVKQLRELAEGGMLLQQAQLSGLFGAKRHCHSWENHF